MSKVITFSRVFPAYHPKKGQPTHFVEKCLKGFPKFHANDFIASKEHPEAGLFDLIDLALDIFTTLSPKYHTIRAGERWKAGEKFSPRVWGTDVNPKSGKSGPYHSKQITIGPDIEIKKVWNITMDGGHLYIKDKEPILRGIESETFCKIAYNDGLSLNDFDFWFIKPFTGQIICWNDEIEYN